MRVLTAIGYILVVVLLIVVVAAVLLGMGTALTYVFSVSVWEATVVVMVVAGAFWLHFTLSPEAYPDDFVEFPPGDDEEPPIIVANLPLRPSRRSRRRRR